MEACIGGLNRKSYVESRITAAALSVCKFVRQTPRGRGPCSADEHTSDGKRHEHRTVLKNRFNHNVEM